MVNIKYLLLLIGKWQQQLSSLIIYVVLNHMSDTT